MAKRTKRRVGVFYAFPSQPPSLEETITATIDSLKAVPLIRQENLRFRPWPDMSVTGRRIITEVTLNIDRAEVFACDLTHPNLNVAFELGYAVGRFKRVWASLDTGIENAAEEYKRLYGSLFPAGYASYVNHSELVNHFIVDHPWSSLDDHLLSDSYKKSAPRAEHPELLYLQPPIETEAVIRTVERLRSSFFSMGLVVDDPSEDPSPSLEWYAEKVHKVDAVLVHLLSYEQRGSLRHNVKASFVAGLSHALKRPVRILAHLPFEPPMDYQQMLKTHATAEICLSALDQWFEELETSLPRRRRRRAEDSLERPVKLDLRLLTVGEHVAENESDKLYNYFVETSDYYAALESQTAILVGRKGTGKTANLLAIETTIREDPRNHVCVIKPPGYEIDGLVQLLQENIALAERGYLIESLWKFLVYSELACSVVDEISRRPAYQVATSDEEELIEQVDARSAFLRPPFSERLDTAVRSLIGLGQVKGAQHQVVRISELLHVNELHDLRRLLGRVLNGCNRVAVLMDNLDKPWLPGHHTEFQAALLSGLLQVATEITEDFRRERLGRERVNLSLVIFMRSDIFTHIQPLVPEQDKLPLHWIVWNDEEVLLSVLDERLALALPDRFEVADLWNELLPNEVAGRHTREFITANTLARPRDVIYMVRQAIAKAVNGQRSAVTQDDFLDARRAYSEFAFRSLLAEDDPNRGYLEEILYEFAGAPREMLESSLHETITRAGVNESDVNFYMDLLCDVNFLGIETADGYRFSSHEGERQVLMNVARKFAANRRKGECSFLINAAFYQVLQID